MKKKKYYSHQEQFDEYLEVCKAAEKIFSFPKDLGALVYLDSERKSSKKNKINLFRMVEFDSNYVYLQSDSIDSMFLVENSQYDYYRNLFNGIIEYKYLRRVTVHQLLEYNLLITMEQIFYLLISEGFKYKDIFINLYQHSLQNEYKELNCFNDGNIKLYILLILYYMSLKNYEYDFNKKIFSLEIYDNEISNLII